MIKKEKINNEKNKELIDDAEVKLASLESAAASLLSLGYASYIYASNIDKLTALNLNTCDIKSINIFIKGQSFITAGYIALFIISDMRIKLISFKNISESPPEEPIGSYKKIAQSYLISVIANLYRLQAFLELRTIENKNDAKKEYSENN